MTHTLAEVMAPVRHVLLDFDGPICSVFGDLSAPVVARRLAEAIDADLPDDVIGTDPLALLTVFAERGRDTLVAAEAKLTELEVEAVGSAPITHGVIEALKAFRETGRTVTVVSNNSQAAVETFVADRDLTNLVTGICSRRRPEPKLLKPNPFLLRRAMLMNGGALTEYLMIGDSEGDVVAAHAQGVPVVFYESRPGKASGLHRVNQAPTVVVNDMQAFGDLEQLTD